MKRFGISGFFFILSAAVLSAQQWPSNPENLAAGFGRAVDGQFGRGLIFRSKGEEISAWDAGTVIWVSLSPSALIVLEHKDGFRSIYRGIRPKPNLPDRVSEGEVLGIPGGGEWEFEILDNQFSWIVSPLSVLPARKNVPSLKIRSVSAEKGLERVVLENDLILNAGDWDIAVDSGSFNTERSLPAELSLYWSGELLDTLNLETLALREGKTIANFPQERTFSRVYKDAAQFLFPKIKLDAGEGTLEVRIRDEYGDIISESWNLKIR